MAKQSRNGAHQKVIQRLIDAEIEAREQVRQAEAEAREMLTGYPMHLGMALASIVLLEAEVDDLIALMEGRINGWSVNRIRSSLIGDRGRQ